MGGRVLDDDEARSRLCGKRGPRILRPNHGTGEYAEAATSTSVYRLSKPSFRRVLGRGRWANSRAAARCVPCQICPARCTEACLDDIMNREVDAPLRWLFMQVRDRTPG